MRNRQTKKLPNRLKIIGGTWRGRTFSFPDIAIIRPTPNRVRETLFNWLAPLISGSYCLDLFAGSGALGLEALSRGASSVTFVDNHREVIAHLQKTIAFLKIQNANMRSLVIPLDNFMVEKGFDIVFLDPPFEKQLIQPCCVWLEKQQLLAKPAYVYIEAEKNLHPLPVPPHWQLIKSNLAGQVGYHLFLRSTF